MRNRNLNFFNKNVFKVYYTRFKDNRYLHYVNFIAVNNSLIYTRIYDTNYVYS